MLQAQPSEEGAGVHKIVEALRTTSRRVKAVGAGLVVFLKAIDRIELSDEVVNVPDQKLIDDVVRLLLTGDKAKCDD